MNGQVKGTYFIEAPFCQGLPVFELMSGDIKIPLQYPNPRIKGTTMTCWVSWQEVAEGDKHNVEKKKLLQAMFQLAKTQIDDIKIKLRNAKQKVVN